MFKKLLILVLFCFFVVGCTQNGLTGANMVTNNAESVIILPSDAVYVLDESSKLLWESSRLVATPHQGSVKVTSGSLLRTSDKFVSGSFVIDMDAITINDGKVKVINHLKNEDFFDVENYPTSKFLLKEITGKNNDLYQVKGDLTILDKTNSITFPAKIQMNNGILRVIAVFEIDRTLWGITYDSGSFFSEVGDRAIKDEVKFALNLFFKEQVGINNAQLVSNVVLGSDVQLAYNELGDLNAPVTFIEYSDYQCPFCKKFTQQVLPLIKEKYIDTGKVKFVFRDFPLEIHREAKSGAVAAHCAGDQGKYFEMHDLLFETKEFTPENFILLSGQLGLDSVIFSSCLEDLTILERVESNIKEAKLIGVSGTPSFSINGVLVAGAQPFEVFEQIIDPNVKVEKVVDAVCNSDVDCAQGSAFPPYCSEQGESCVTSTSQRCSLPGTIKSECVVIINEVCEGCSSACDDGICS